MTQRGGLRSVQGGLPDPEEIDPEIRPFKDYAEMYYANGWIPLPLPARKKANPPNRTTGRHDPPSWQQVKEWINSPSVPDFANIAIRMPPYAFGIDVDNYGEKPGGVTMALVAEQSGEELPPAPVSSARTDGVSGIRYLLVPDDRIGHHLPGKLGPGVEIIQHRHRYAVAPPSVHEDFERHYRWYNPGQKIDGSGTFVVPVARRVAVSAV